MATTLDYLNQLQNDKQILVDNLNSKGVNATNEETFTTLCPKIADIPTGDGMPRGHYDREGLKSIGYTDDVIDLYDSICPWTSEQDELFKLTEEDKSYYGVVTDSNVRNFKKDIVYMPFYDFKYEGQNEFSEFYKLRTIPKLSTSNAEYFDRMFYRCYSLQTIPSIDTSKARYVQNMFSDCYSLKSVSLTDTSKAMYMQYMFMDCYSLHTVSPLNTGNALNTRYMFYNCYSLKSVSLTDTSKASDMSGMFHSCYSLEGISPLDLSSVTDAQSMFYGCYSLKAISELNTPKLANMSYMFQECRSIETISLTDTSNATSMYYTFSGCSSLKSISELNTSKVTNIGYAFNSCYALKTISLTDTSKVTNMEGTFCSCYSLLSISQLDASSVISLSYSTFSTAHSLEEFGGLLNLGKAYLTTASSDYSYYRLDLSSCVKLTHDSLMNVINGLYDIASIGVQPQGLKLGSTNLGKLTEEEIAIATEKGWIVN